MDLPVNRSMLLQILQEMDPQELGRLISQAEQVKMRGDTGGMFSQPGGNPELERRRRMMYSGPISEVQRGR